jgi:hypothetical protein
MMMSDGRHATDYGELVIVLGLGGFMFGLMVVGQTWAGPPLRAWELTAGALAAGVLLILNSALLLYEFNQGDDMRYEDAKALITERWGPPDHVIGGTSPRATWGGVDLRSDNGGPAAGDVDICSYNGGPAWLHAGGGPPWPVTKRGLSRVLRDVR